MVKLKLGGVVFMDMVKLELNLNVFNEWSNNKATVAQVIEVNKALEKGISLNQFGRKLGIDEANIRKKFKRIGYERSKEGKKLFELKEGVQAAPVVNDHTGIEDPKQKGVINIAAEGDKHLDWMNIESFTKRLSSVETELKNIKKQLKSVGDARSTASTDKLELKDFATGLKQISYRYNLEVLNKFNDLCQQYPNYSKTKILNTLLDEAISKYLK